MHGFIDLHSHWVAAIDDGPRSVADGRAMLEALKSAGFDRVVATPHMRPGMFDNTRADLVAAFERTVAELGTGAELPTVDLSSEHFFDDVVFERFLSGDVLPYPGGSAALVELGRGAFPARLQHRFHDLARRGMRPVLAHPERYEPVWKDIQVLDPLLDVGAVLLMDLAALVGKYGRGARKTAEKLLDEGYYYAACSDAHKAADVDDVRRGIDQLLRRAGEEEMRFLLAEGPGRILSGRVET